MKTKFVHLLLGLVILLCLHGCYTDKPEKPNGDLVMTIKDMNIYYTERINSKEINAIADSFFYNSGDSIRLDKQDSIYYVSFIIPHTYIDLIIKGEQDKEFDNNYKYDAKGISLYVYVNSKVVVNVCDNHFKVYKSYEYDPESDK